MLTELESEDEVEFCIGSGDTILHELSSTQNLDEVGCILFFFLEVIFGSGLILKKKKTMCLNFNCFFYYPELSRIRTQCK